MNKSALDTLVEAAVLAPSGDNTQPWQFEINREAGTISVGINPTRDRSPMNAAQRMARIAIGAAIENMVQTSKANQWLLDIQPEAQDATIRVRLSQPLPPGTIPEVLRRRVTNRRVYQKRALDPSVLTSLTEGNPAETADGARPLWLTAPDQLATLTEFIARADRLILSNQQIRNAFLSKVRFDQQPNETVDMGLSLGTLEVTPVERTLLRLMQWLPDAVIKGLGAGRTFYSVASRLAGSAAAICVVLTDHNDNQSDIAAGRCWQRVWLRVADAGLAAQPMMSLLVLQNISDNGDSKLQMELGRKKVQDLLNQFNGFIKSLAPGRPAALMRVGYALAPTARTGRLPLDQVLKEQV